MLNVQSNGETLSASIAGDASEFAGAQLDDCIGWWRDRMDFTGTTLNAWVDLSGNNNHLPAPPVPGAKPSAIQAAYLDQYPAVDFDGVAQYLSLASYGPVFTGDDIPITVVCVHEFPTVIVNSVMYGLCNTANATPLHEAYITAGNYFTFRRDDGGFSNNLPLAVVPGTGLRISVDIFKGGATPTRTWYQNGISIRENVSSNQAICTFDEFVVGASLAGGAPVGFTNMRTPEMAVYARALSATEAFAWARYAITRYQIP